MAKYNNTKENVIAEGESFFFENQTDSSFEVSTGIVFHKDGLYEVNVNDNWVTVSKKGSTRSKGKWIIDSEKYDAVTCVCSECGQNMTTEKSVRANYCWNCGADMRGDIDE